MRDEVKKLAAAIGANEPAPNEKNYKLFRNIFKRQNYFILKNKLVIIKISRSPVPMWGVGKQFIDLLSRTQNYFLILIVSDSEGWCFCKSEIILNILNKRWQIRGYGGDYKIYPELPRKNYFMSPEGLLDIINQYR